MRLISFMLNIAMLVIILILAIGFVLLIKRNIKNKKIVDCIVSLEDEDLFYPKMNDYLETMKNDEFLMKGKILKLWADIYYSHDDEIASQLEEINFLYLVEEKGLFKKNKRELNEDSLYYFLIASTNTIYSRGSQDLIALFKKKIKENENYLEKSLVYQISQEAMKLFESNDDLGESFFKQVLEGEYSEYSYAKQMIGLYKTVCEVYLSKIALLNNKMEVFEQYKEDLIRFNESSTGKRFIKELAIDEELLK